MAKVAILHQGFIPPYRVRFYELLEAHRGVEYVVFHGQPATGTGWEAAKGPFAFPNREIANREIRLLRWTAIYQPVVREILHGGYDAVVLGHELKFLSNLLLALLCRMRGIKVLFWGFGYHVRKARGESGRLGRIAEGIAALAKDGLTRLASGYLVYTSAGAEELRKTGFPPDRIWVLRNTIDMTGQFRLRDALAGTDPQAIRAELGLPSAPVILLFVGRLLEAKRADLLIEAVRRINQGRDKPRVLALIVGGGPMEQEWRRQAEGLESVRFLGSIQDQGQMARLMRVSAAVVIPGFVGLAVNHAFAQGLPVITRREVAHAPEIEYLADGENGMIVAGDEGRFCAALDEFVASPERQSELARGARRSGESLRLEAMAEEFDRAVRFVIGMEGRA